MSEVNIPGLDVWAAEPLGDLCDIVIGRTPSRNRPEYWGGDHPWLSIADMNQGRLIQTTKERITSTGASESRSRIVSRGTVLLSFKLSIGKVSIADIDTYTNEAIAALPIRDTNKLNRDYLFWCLQSIRLDKEVDAAAKGKTLNSKKLERLSIPLPPLHEQEQIAAVLDKADALRNQRQESLQLTEKLLQSVFLDLFGDPVENPKGWAILELGEFGIVQTGNTPPRSNKDNYAATGLEWIKTDNIVEDRVFVTPATEKLSAIGEKAARVAPADSLLVACIAGSEKSIGRAALTDRRVAFNQQINAITPHADVSPVFLYFLMKVARHQVQLAAGKGMKKIINKSTFESLRFIAPDEDQQRQFERVAKKLIAQRQDCHEQLSVLEALFSSLQQRAFRGGLDLSRLKLGEGAEKPTLPPAAEPVEIQGRYNRPGSFIAPPEIETQMMALEDELDGPGDSIPWSEDYFKYRTLSQVLLPPFAFGEIWQEVNNDMPDASYETVKSKIFEYVAQGTLEQRFDEEDKQMVFYSRP